MYIVTDATKRWLSTHRHIISEEEIHMTTTLTDKLIAQATELRFLPYSDNIFEDLKVGDKIPQLFVRRRNNVLLSSFLD